MKKLILIILFPTLLCAQYFGKNKVQYKDFDWRMHTTPHFEIFFYEEELAEFASCVLEKEIGRISSVLGRVSEGKVPVIIYASHNDFEQTNVILDLIEEGVGGFTELYKNCVVVPFTGSYEELRHVLTHELVHIVQFSSISGTPTLLQNTMQRIPLWYIEGMAEYMSQRDDPETDLILRDLVYYDRLTSIEDIWKIEGSYLMYKEGQSILKFIADRYGEPKIGEIYHNIGFIGGFDGTLKQTIGIDEKTLSREWIIELSKKAWTFAKNRDEFPKGARRMTKRNEGYTFNIAPSVSPDGSEFVFMSDRDQYGSIYLASAITGKVKRKVIESGKQREFESIYIMEGSISWTPDGNNILFVSKIDGRNVMYIMDPHTSKLQRKFTPPPPVISSPVISRDGRFIVFRGVMGAKADIYITNIETGKTLQLTDDVYDDRTPRFYDESIFFASDRPKPGEEWKYGEYAIYSIRLNGTGLKRINDKRSRETKIPVLYNDSLLYYLASYPGKTDIYFLNLNNKEELQVTDVMGSIESYSLSDNQKVFMSLYIEGGWDIFSLELPFEGAPPSEEKEYDIPYVAFEEGEKAIEVEKPGLRFSPDFAGGTISVANNSLLADAYIAVSDILGNHRFFLVTDYPGNLLESNFNFSYWYLEKRINFGFALFKEEYPQLLWYDILQKETYTGFGCAMEYPFDKFKRVETGLDLYSIEWTRSEWDYQLEKWIVYEDATNYISALSLSYVFDNALWGYTGPVNGKRLKLTAGYAMPITDLFLSYMYLGGDARKYIRIHPGYYFAMRLFGESMESNDFARLRIGGTGSIRGYDYFEFAGYNIGGINLEFRYPFIEYLRLGFPLPLEIYGIRGALFLDGGYAIDDINKLRIFKDEGLKDIKMGFGTGIRIRFPYFVLLFDIAKNTDLKEVSRDIRYHIMLGSEF